MKQISLLLLLTVFGISSAASQDRPEPEPVSPRTALYESLIFTGIPVAVGGGLLIADHQNNSQGHMSVLGGILSFSGLWFGPSTGHFRADNPRRAFTGVSIRTAALLAMGVGAMQNASETTCGSSDDDSGDPWIIGGGAVFVLSAILDVAAAPKSAESYSRRKADQTLSLLPNINPVEGRYGLTMALRF